MSHPSFDQLRRAEFGRLDAAGQVYLDYTGSALYPDSLVREHARDLAGAVLGNPHSRNPTSRAATERVDEVRERVLRFFDADPSEYEVVFTGNATGAIKLVAESFPFGPGSRFVLTADNHNSVHGIREFACGRGAETRYVPLGEELRVGEVEAHLPEVGPEAASLFAFPAQSNFSGVKHPLEWVDLAQARGYQVLLDAAAFAPTSPLSLRECSPDFACVSFYKMFGFPTGVGALLARHGALGRLKRPWFSGGTVRFVSAQVGVELLYANSRGFEDGTLNFLGILAVANGLDFLDRIGMDRIRERITGLTDLLLREMQTLRHPNGAPVACVYGPAGTERRGGTVAFNLLDPEGRVWDFRRVDDLAGEARISLRTGYFCNPGAAEFALEHPEPEVRRCVGTFSADTFNIQAFSDCLDERAVGAVRVSVGVPTTAADIGHLVGFLAGFRDRPAPRPVPDGTTAASAPPGIGQPSPAG